MSVTGQGRVSARSSVLILLSILALVLSAAYLVRPLVPSVLAAEPTVVLEEGIEGCMGVRTTPGSENTTKELVGGTLEPGGTATFRFTFPAEVEGNPGQEEWKLTDCVFINDDPQQKYTVTALVSGTGWPCGGWVSPTGIVFHFSDAVDRTGAGFHRPTTLTIVEPACP